MTMSGASTGRKDLVYELRETSLLSNAVAKCVMVDKAVQSEPIMDMSSGDSVDYTIVSPISSHDTNGESNYFRSHETFVKDTAIIPLEASPLSSSPLARRALHKSLESVVHTTTADPPQTNHVSTNLTQAIVEDQQQQQQQSNEPRYKINQSDPTVPSLSEHSKSSTLRLSDRTRSESEDDIEKMEESEPDGDLGHGFSKTGVKTSETNTEKKETSPGETEKGEDWRPEQETETDCAVQCLYYTIQCCECTIL